MKNEPYNQWIQFRISDSEKALIKTRAAQNNQSISADLRSQALETKQEKPEPDISKALTETLANIGNQLNLVQRTLGKDRSQEAINFRMLNRLLKRLIRGWPNDRR
ncbi:plasmid mobilization protein [Endozoicomonas sp.]|uniref:plasmid mobilization protein n=1 Tax=Endozoicomonas sp. TaxID=1892382 RepID=UPI0028850B84|nr:hypothetical protein [Endozoicomonas sp.]